jgi:hypothetical protein
VVCFPQRLPISLLLARIEVFVISRNMASARNKMENNFMKSTNDSPEFEKFSQFVRGVVDVPRAEVKRKLNAEKKQREKKKRAKASTAPRVSNDSPARENGSVAVFLSVTSL